MGGHLGEGLERGEGEPLQHRLRSEVEDPGGSHQRQGEETRGPIPRAQPEQEDCQTQVDDAEQVVPDDLEGGGNLVGGIGGPCRHPSPEAGAEALDMKGLVKGR